MPKVWSVLLLAAVLLGSAGIARAQSSSDAPPATGIRTELLAQVDDLEKKVVDLAGAIPEKTYAWRPGKGVRSTSEVFMHIVGGNYMFPSIAGFKSSTSISPDLERTVTEKAKVIDYMKSSFGNLRKALSAVNEEDLDKQVTMFGSKTTVRNAYLVAVMHLHEHLGQAIAYARTNGVAPPWTAGGR
jgi:uncharacterized damage-inducible protein DinB